MMCPARCRPLGRCVCACELSAGLRFVGWPLRQLFVSCILAGQQQQLRRASVSICLFFDQWVNRWGCQVVRERSLLLI